MSKKEEVANKRISDIIDEKYPQLQLFDKIKVINHIFCNICNFHEEVEGEPIDIIDYLYYDKGWRFIENKVVCKKCQKTKEYD